MALVVVGGHTRNIGKTSVMEGLIAGLSGPGMDRSEDHAVWPRCLLGRREGM